MNRPKKTEKSTIELLISTDIIQNDKNKKGTKVSEEKLLNLKENSILIGAPGAGKTTTLKRLILRYFNDIQKEQNYGFPILIRLRSLEPNLTLSKHLLNIFSIKYEDRLIKTIKKVPRKVFVKGNVSYEGAIYDEIIEERIVTYVDNITISSFIPKFLNATGSILMLDGLDEVEKNIQNDILREIEAIGLKLNNAKIILTIRKSEINKIISGFTKYDVAPLNQKQITTIVSKWIENGEEFLKEINSKPYKDLANRPIFLTLLMVLFEKHNELPNQPSEVYQDATYLILNEWDEHRDITRKSKYGNFNARKKMKFLSEISYYLTYKIRQKKFTSKELSDIYININSKYDLPLSEMKTVISEIESHTGIIVEGKYKEYEFSHLSIQEFLCANHFVNLPYSEETIKYFLDYPEPLAIAICISAEPSLWFSNLFLNRSLTIGNFNQKVELYFSSVFTLLSRLLIESPVFKLTYELGYTTFYLISHLEKNKEFKEIIPSFFEYKNVKQSLALALDGFVIKFVYSSNSYHLTRIDAAKTNQFIEVITSGELSDSIVKKLIKDNLIKIVNERVQSSVSL